MDPFWREIALNHLWTLQKNTHADERPGSEFLAFSSNFGCVTRCSCPACGFEKISIWVPSKAFKHLKKMCWLRSKTLKQQWCRPFFSVLTMTILCGFVEWCLLLEMFNQSPIQPINLTKKCQSRKANSPLIYPGPLIFVPVAANSYPLTKECRWHQGIHCIIWTPWVTHSHFSEELDDFDIENIRILSCLELLLPTLEATFKTRSCKISWGDLSETLGVSLWN